MEPNRHVGDNRRQSTRIALSIPTKAKLKDQGDNQGYKSMVTRDISNRGAFFKTDSPFPLASELKVVLDMGKMLVKAVGNVVRVEAEGMAVAFTWTDVAVVKT